MNAKTVDYRKTENESNFHLQLQTTHQMSDIQMRPLAPSPDIKIPRME